MASSEARDFERQKFEIWISNLLRTGVALSSAIVLTGGVLFLVRHGLEIVDHHVFQGEPQSLRSPAGIAMAALHGNELAVIQLGLLLLMATPVARVALSLGVFSREGDRIYIVVTLIVLVILLTSLTGR